MTVSTDMGTVALYVARTHRAQPVVLRPATVVRDDECVAIVGGSCGPGKIKSILPSGPLPAWWVANSRLCKPTRRSAFIADRYRGSIE